MNKTAPIAKKIAHVISKHEHSRNDDYFWMNERDSEDVVAYLDQENAYAKEVLQQTEILQEEIYKEMIGRINQKDESVPYLYAGYYYYARVEEGKEYPIYCRKQGGLEAEEEILLNVNDLASGQAFCSVGNVEVSGDQKYIIYSVDFVSRRQYDIYFKNRLSGELEKVIIKNTSGEFVVANVSKTIFYTKKDEALRPF